MTSRYYLITLDTKKTGKYATRLEFLNYIEVVYILQSTPMSKYYVQLSTYQRPSFFRRLPYLYSVEKTTRTDYCTGDIEDSYEYPTKGRTFNKWKAVYVQQQNEFKERLRQEILLDQKEQKEQSIKRGLSVRYINKNN